MNEAVKQGLTVVRLTFEETLYAQEVAIKRVREIHGRPNHTSRFDRKIGFHEYVSQIADSIGAEIAVAKYFQIRGFDPADSKFKRTADVASGIEVKWTKHEFGNLIVYPSDREDDIAVLVTGLGPAYTIRGWIPVKDAMRDKYFNSHQHT